MSFSAHTPITSSSVVALTWVLKDMQGEVLDTLEEPVEFFVGGEDLLQSIVDALLQHAQLVAAGDLDVVAQVTGRNAFHHGQGFLERARDLAGDDECRDDANQQRQQGADQLQATGLGAFGVAALKLNYKF